MSGSNPAQHPAQAGQTYFVRFRGRVFGPLRRAEVVEQLRSGRISALHEISVDNVEWTLIRDSEGFVPALPTRMPPPAPASSLSAAAGGTPTEAPLPEARTASVRPPNAGPPPAAIGGASLPGRVTCPNCGQSEWTSDRGCIFWGLVVLFFPLGLLLLLIVPTWTCTTCQYTFRSHDVPTSTRNSGSSMKDALMVLGIVFVIVVVIAALNARK